MMTDVSKPNNEQNETLCDTWWFTEHFYEQIVEYYKSRVDEGVAVHEEGEVEI